MAGGGMASMQVALLSFNDWMPDGNAKSLLSLPARRPLRRPRNASGSNGRIADPPIPLVATTAALSRDGYDGQIAQAHAGGMYAAPGRSQRAKRGNERRRSRAFCAR